MVSNEKGPLALAGGEGIGRTRVLVELESRGPRGATFDELSEALRPLDAPSVLSALAELERDGVATDWSRRWYAVRHTEWMAGTVERLESGDALVRSGARREAGFYIQQRHLKGAEDRDTVLIKRLKGRSPAAGNSLPLAAVVKVLAVRF